jgi:hypothetical protein
VLARDVAGRDNKSVVPNGVSGPKTNPLRDRAVLLLRLGELLLRPERLVALWWWKKYSQLWVYQFRVFQSAVPSATNPQV